MPLIFTIQSEETATAELAKARAWDIVPGQVFAKFEVYKVLAMHENEKHYPDQLAGLPDPSALSVRQQTSVRKVYGVSRRFNTAVYTARLNVRGHNNNLSDRQNMSFMVNMQKWLRDTFRQQTDEVVARYILTEVQNPKRQKLDDPQ